MKNLFSIKDKVIIITGGGGSIGQHLAFNMAQHNAYVYCVDLKFKKRIPKSLSSYLFKINCDITKQKQFKKICSKIFKIYKKIDVLVNCAGTTYPTTDNYYSEKKWKDTLNVNLTAPFNCSQMVFQYMAKNKCGSIINITSIAAEVALPKNPAYASSKGGLKMLGKALAKDWARFGIRVNNLGPGYIRTDMTENSFSNKKKRIDREKRTMLGRWGTKDDLVGPCIFLASDASNYITGQDIYVDGGWLANGL